jgi:CDP-diacylglycerol--serine O-phosphatidyltransferase
MVKKSLFIVQLNPADYLTLIGLFFAGISIIQVLSGNFYLAIAFMFLGMFADAFDGVISRKFGWASEFGRYLDGFVDIFNYLVAPLLFLYLYGLNDTVSLMVIFIFIASGILRLSKFNMIGNIEEGDKLSYLGLPVFWSQFLVVILVVLSWYLPKNVFIIISDLALLGMSFCMILNKKSWKPQKYVVMILVMLAIIIWFFYLHFMGA